MWWRVAAALLVSLALQVGVNYANDYSDGVRGTDDVRVGPTRLVASGLASPAAVKRAALASFAVAAVAGLAIALSTSLLLLLVGAAAIAAGWFYTGGPKPYGYLGLGEVFVFVFFGLVATAGTTYAANESVTALSLVMGSAVGALACALLVINNLRDIPTDREVGKKTLAVRLGERRTRWFYVALVGAAFALSAVGAAWRLPVLRRAGRDSARSATDPLRARRRQRRCADPRARRDRTTAARLGPARHHRPRPLTCLER